MAYSTQTLAEGCFGKVYKEKFGDSWAALKRVPVGLINKYELERECKVYKIARHPNVVNLLGDPWIKDAKWNIPMEFILGEDLETTIFKTQSSKIQLTPAVRATIITGMCEGLLYLHSKDIVHQDLKPDNIMVDHQAHRAVIIDLGLAKFSKNGLSSAANMGNEAYSAPEILQTRGIRDKRSDVWAMGKVIAELCARIRLPTQYVSASKIQEYLKEQPYCKPVTRMVETNPSNRTSMAGVISDIRRAASASQTDIKPRDVTVTQGNEIRGNQRCDLQAPAPPRMEIRKPSVIDYRPSMAAANFDSRRAASASQTDIKPRDFTVTQGNEIKERQRQSPQPPALFKTEVSKPPVIDYRPSMAAVNFNSRRAASASQTDQLRDFTVTQGNEIREHQRQSPQPPALLKTEVSKPPVLNYRQNPPQHREMGKAVVPLNVAGLNNQMSLMSFPCPLPETGKVTQERYNDRGLMEYKEIITKEGKITKYEKVQMNKRFFK